MTDRSDRAGGDCPQEKIAKAIEDQYPGFQNIAKYVRSLGSEYFGELAASPPSGNAGEEAEQADIARCIETIENSYAFKTFGGIPLRNCGEWIYLKKLLSAPPQPAPDALREQFGWRWRDAHLAGSPDWHIGLSPPAGFRTSERWIVEPLYADRKSDQ